MAEYSIVIPVYNEEKTLPEFYKRLKEVMDSTDSTYELIFINDGSKDFSGTLIREFRKSDVNVKILEFSRNFGHQIAISAGLDYAFANAVVIIDADLQDPPNVILKMIEKWKEGYDVIYGKRLQRKGDSIFKKLTAFVFYRLLKYLTNYDIPIDTGDFRLIDKKVCESIRNFSEKNRYMRGLLSWVGFNQTFVEYKREARWAGKTKYPLSKMIKFGLDAIFSFSYKPLRLASYLGFALSVLSFLYLMLVVYQKLFTNTTIVGWSSIIAINLFCNGIVLIILGMIGEYIGRIYEESKDRPLYIISNKVGF